MMLTDPIERALRNFASDARKAKGHGIDKVIVQPSLPGYRGAVVAKPTTYQPSPCGAPVSGKRKRQWR